MPGDGECAAARHAGQPCAVTAAKAERSRDHLCRPFDLLHRHARRRADRDRLQRRLPDRPPARCRHHEPRARHPLHFVSRSANSACPARLGRRRTAGADRSSASATSIIRNVTTDIRRYFGEDSSGEMIKDGNSIFIFEVAGLCIGHLGHLHHKLDDTHFAAIGRLDIVMVPIDGTYTMSLDGISDDHAAAARLRGAADASLRDPARRIHAPDRPAIRHRLSGPSGP